MKIERKLDCRIQRDFTFRMKIILIVWIIVSFVALSFPETINEKLPLLIFFLTIDMIIFIYRKIVIKKIKSKSKLIIDEHKITIKVPTFDEVISEGNSILQKALLYSRISKTFTFLLIVLVIIMYFKMKKENINIKEYKINCFLFSITGIIGILHHFFINTEFMGYILLLSALLTVGLYIWTNFQNSSKENLDYVEENNLINVKDKNIENKDKDFF